MSLGLLALSKEWQHNSMPIRPVYMPESRIQKQAEALGTKKAEKMPRLLDLAALKTAITKAATQNNFDALSVLDWRYSPFALAGDGGILSSFELMARYLLAVKKKLRPRIVRSLARLYCNTFSIIEKHTEQLSHFLINNSTILDTSWQQAQIKYSFFDHTKVINNLVNLCSSCTASSQDHISIIFKNAALPVGLQSSPLALCILTILLKRIANQTMLTEEDIKRVIALCSTEQGDLLNKTALLIGHMAEALLLPLRSPNSNPALCQRVQSYLLHCLGDPRLHNAQWFGVSTEAKELILRWLTKQSLDLFLDITDKVVNTDDDAKRMWHFRVRFWRSYLHAGHIDEAWVVLGNKGQAYAHSIEKRGTQETLSFAILTQSPDIETHIVLMLRIDSLTIVDWSHNGKCHIWVNNRNNHPKLYEKYYTKTELERGSIHSFTHYKSGSWRDEVANVIRKETGRYTNYSR
ncbi:MAG: EH signature domain-containing protein [Desulfovibrionaceae bacterium]|nr:EH signature domain-containing protein [Desulfovibrionaceae bacterium]